MADSWDEMSALNEKNFFGHHESGIENLMDYHQPRVMNLSSWSFSLEEELSAGELDFPHSDSFENSSNNSNFSFGNDTYVNDPPNGTSLPIDMQFNDGHILLISCYSGIFFVSLIGNLCVLKAILGGGRKQRKSRVNLMLLHLAIADLIVTTVMIPVEVGWAATVQWMAGDTFCRLFAFFRIFGHYLSSFILVCISIDRYFAVVHPLSLNAADRRGRIMLCFAWFLAFSCSLPQVMIFHVENHPLFTFYVQCVTFNFFPTKHHEMFYNLFCLVMLYVAPLSIIIIFYGAIVITIFQKSRLSDDTNIRRSSLGYLGRARARTIKMTVSIVLAFFVCWTPYVVISLWFCFDHSAAALLDEKVKKGLFIFACFNSCVNPIVYGIFNFCKKKQPMTQTWRSTTLNTQLNSRSCECRSFKSSRVYWSRRDPESTVTNSEVTDHTAELLLPRALNSPYRTRTHSGSDSAVSLPLQALTSSSPLSRRHVAEREKSSRSPLTTQFRNGSYVSSSGNSLAALRSGNDV